jgi:hypothetical protein
MPFSTSQCAKRAEPAAICVETQDLVGSVSVRNAHRGAARSIRMTADALVRYVEIFAITVEEFPQRP